MQRSLRSCAVFILVKGYLSESLILRTRGMPAAHTLHRHVGTYKQLYKLVGYRFPEQDNYGNRTAEPSLKLRRNLVKRLRSAFPEHVTVKSLPTSTKSVLEIDHSFDVSVIVCVSYQKPNEGRNWVVLASQTERQNITLLCKLNPSRTRIQSYHLLPRLSFSGKSHRSYENDPILEMGIRLTNLSRFYSAVKALKAKVVEQSV